CKRRASARISSALCESGTTWVRPAFEGKAEEDGRLVAIAPSDLAAGERNDETRRGIEANEEPDVAEADAKLIHDHRGDGSGRLKLEGHAEANSKQQEENHPAIVRVHA